MFKHYFLALILYLSFPFFGTAQKIDFSVGVEVRPELYFQRTSLDHGFFDKQWTADILGSVGADLEIKYGKLSVGAGVFATALGFNKNNPDTAEGLFIPAGRGRTRIVDNLKYRVHLVEVPLNMAYMFSVKKFYFKFGLSYSLYFRQRAFIKDITYYEYNIENEQEVLEMKNYMLSNSTDHFNSFSPYFEFEYLSGHFSLSYKAGLRFHTKKYHDIFVDKPFSFYLGLGMNYYLISKK